MKTLVRIISKSQMRRNYCLIIFMTLFVSCTNKRSFEKFDFSYSDEASNFSIQFTQSDTVYVGYNFSYFDIFDSIDVPKSKTNYFAIMEKKDSKDLDNLLSKIDFEKYDTAYYQNFDDGFEYKLYIKNENLEKTIYSHSFKGPKELDSLAEWIYKLVKSLKLNKIDKKLNFKSKIYHLPPPKFISNDN
jgi:hypothetical protein